MWDAPDLRILYDLQVLPIFDHAHPVIIKLSLPFLNLCQHAKKSAHFINSLSWDTADSRVPWSTPRPFLTTTTQKQTFQPDLLRNWDKNQKWMPNNAAHHGWAMEKKYNMYSDGLKQPFPNFLFSTSAISYLIFFPEIKTKIQSFTIFHIYYHW